MITADEWETLCLLIEEGWPGEFTDATSSAWRVLLDDFDSTQVLGAVKTLVASGGTFRPSVAEIVAAIRHDPSAPTFEEMLRLVFGPDGIMRARPSVTTFPDGGAMARAYHEARKARAGEVHPLVGAFALRYGLDRLAGLELDHAEYGDLKRKELRASWDQHVKVMDGRDVAALVSGRRAEGLRAFDPLATLGDTRPQIQTGGAA